MNQAWINGFTSKDDAPALILFIAGSPFAVFDLFIHDIVNTSTYCKELLMKMPNLIPSPGCKELQSILDYAVDCAHRFLAAADDTAVARI